MKNRMSDVRDHLVAAMESLNDNNAADPTAVAVTIERAKALAALSATYIASVKVEVDARRYLAESGVDLPTVLKPKPVLPGQSS